jgi:hypothetical protein
MEHSNVVEIASKRKQNNVSTRILGQQGVVIAMRVTNHPSNLSESLPEKKDPEITDRVDAIVSTMVDALAELGHDDEALFILKTCQNIAENGGSDAEIGHTAFEYIKNFPDVVPLVQMQADADSVALNKRIANRS